MATAIEEFVADSRFSQSLELHGIDGRDVFRVAYADFGYRNVANPEEERVLLYFAPMLGSRFIYVAKDEMAKSHGVRVICIDRPGFGATDAIDVAKRIDVTREITVALLAHLNIKHVYIACHSGGSVYALDMLLHHPELLHPEHPYLAIGAPWAHPTNTGVTHMRIASVLPRMAIGSVDKIATFFMNAQPVLGPTVGFISGLGQYVSGVPSGAGPVNPDDDAAIRFEAEVHEKLFARIHEDGLAGTSDEALLLMKRVDDGSVGWGTWGNFDVLLPQLSDALRSARRKLKVRVFFAEKDFLIGDAGTAGPRWLEETFQKETRVEDAVISYSSSVVKGTDHDTAWENRFGVPQSVFRDISRKDDRAPNEGAASHSG